MEVTGKVIVISPVQEGVSKAGKPWKKRFYVIETQDTYPRKIAFTVFGEDRVNEYERLINNGMMVRVSFDIDSREWQGRWFTDISAWRIEVADGTASQSQPVQNTVAVPGAVPPPPAIAAADPTDDLPF